MATFPFVATNHEFLLIFKLTLISDYNQELRAVTIELYMEMRKYAKTESQPLTWEVLFISILPFCQESHFTGP
jgi:hypothetical protein